MEGATTGKALLLTKIVAQPAGMLVPSSSWLYSFITRPLDLAQQFMSRQCSSFRRINMCEGGQTIEKSHCDILHQVQNALRIPLISLPFLTDLVIKEKPKQLSHPLYEPISPLSLHGKKHMIILIIHSICILSFTRRSQGGSQHKNAILDHHH